jgi:hypothetical protein
MGISSGCMTKIPLGAEKDSLIGRRFQAPQRGAACSPLSGGGVSSVRIFVILADAISKLMNRRISNH